MATATTTATATDPAVTLITTVRNGERFLGEALASIQAQTFDAWTLILVDDGSTDASGQIARDFAATEPRCQLFECEGRGRLDALRFAHARVKTKYVAWVDADDRLRPCALQACVRALEDAPWAPMVFTQRMCIDEAGASRPQRPRIRPSGTNLLRSFSTFHFRLIRQTAFDAAGGLGDYPIGIDYDLCLRLWEQGVVLGLDEVLYEYRRHGAQMSTAKRHAQVEASSSAVRDAIGRRGLERGIALELQGNRPRFVLRDPRSGSGFRRASEAATRRLRAWPRSAVVWPHHDRHLDVLVDEALHANAVGVRPIGPKLSSLVECRPCPDLVVLRDGARAVNERHLGRLLGALARMRAEGARIVACTWEPSGLGPLERVCHAVLADALPPMSAGLVPIRLRRLARARLGLPEAGRVVLIHARGEPELRAALERASGAVLVIGPRIQGTDARWVEGKRGPRLDAVAAADLVMFADPHEVGGATWCEAIAMGRAVHVCGARLEALRRAFDAGTWLTRGEHIGMSRGALAARGLRLREEMLAHDTATFGRRLIETPRATLLRTAWRRPPR